ncbi:trypsin-like serine protease [Corynebacterium aquatimens]|uniref:trypsin-like serine protease n=1 Tax=Corynebacterium TaxID=1716 RepID=UPI001F377991|nr:MULTISPECIES: trypsin-like serine protease [Corynebacterium]QYH19907.1 trypsin-like serine protease [Corynebacterium aquatimens]UIZ92927.1 trypsin-like serine protease [Corynebacterium sp. CNCTC7651]
MKRSRALVAALGTAAILANPLQAIAAVPTVPTQGDALFLDSGLTCTIGYNDAAKGVSYTAAHCGRDGARVSLVDRSVPGATYGVNLSQPMGTLRHSKNFDGMWSNDIATIEWDPGVKLGGNPYSGDTVLKVSSMTRGDKVCYHGETSHTGTKNTSCGTFFAATDEHFTVRSTAASRAGDSGGPIFVEGKGLVGIVSRGPDELGKAGWVQIGPVRIPAKDYMWATTLNDSKKLTQAQIEAAIKGAAGVDEAGLVDGLVDGVKTKLGFEGSSSSSNGETVGGTGKSVGQIVAIIFTVVLPILGLLSQVSKFIRL